MLRSSRAGGSQIQQISDLAKKLQNAKDPNALLQTMAAQDERVAATLDLVKSSGGSMKQIYYSMAKLKGKDPNEALNMLNKYMRI